MRKSLITLSIVTTSALLVAAGALPAMAYDPPAGGNNTGTSTGGQTNPAAAAAQDPLATSVGDAGTFTTATAASNSGAGTIQAKVNGSVLGGNLSAKVYGANLSPAILNGTDTRSMSGTSGKWTLIDARGTGASWNLAVSVSDFVSPAGVNVARTILARNLAIDPGAFGLATDTSAAAATGSVDSDNGTTSNGSGSNSAAVNVSPLAYNSTASSPVTHTLVTGADSTAGTYVGAGAKGDYIFSTPTYTLTIPRNAYKSNVDATSGAILPYAATITFTMS